MISLIIPIYNEEKVLTKNYLQFRNLSKKSELIFVDGGSSDDSLEIAESYGKVIDSEKGRAVQMNNGVSSAKNDILLFLHADTMISVDVLSSVERAIKDNGFMGGCLSQRIDEKGLVYRFIESFGNTRAKITKVFYGDQGIFVRKDIFLKMNGFPEVPVMEDVIFTKRLRKFGKTIMLADKILVSARRWKENGIMRTIIFYSLINILFWLRVPLRKIKLLYKDLR